MSMINDADLSAMRREMAECLRQLDAKDGLGSPGSTFGDTGNIDLAGTTGSCFSYGSDTENWLPSRAYEPGEPGMWDGKGSGSLEIHEGPATGGLDWDGVRNSLDTQDYPRNVPRPVKSKLIQVGAAPSSASASKSPVKSMEEMEMIAFMDSPAGKASYREKAALLTGCIQGNLAMIGFAPLGEHARFGFSNWTHVRTGEPMHLGIAAMYVMRFFSRPVYDYVCAGDRFSRKVKVAMSEPAVEALDFLVAMVDILLVEKSSTIATAYAKAMGPAMMCNEYWMCVEPYPVYTRLSILLDFIKWAVAKHNELTKGKK